MANYSKEIARLEKLVNGAVQTISTDGTTTTFDLAKAKARLAELYRLQGEGPEKAKRKVAPLNLGGCW
jgi:hypothetical protein